MLRQASKLPAVFDRAWEQLGGGPPDLTFPEPWLGVWRVQSTLTNVQLPLGADFVPDPRVRRPACPGGISSFFLVARLPYPADWPREAAAPCRACAQPPEELCLVVGGGAGSGAAAVHA